MENWGPRQEPRPGSKLPPSEDFTDYEVESLFTYEGASNFNKAIHENDFSNFDQEEVADDEHHPESLMSTSILTPDLDSVEVPED